MRLRKRATIHEMSTGNRRKVGLVLAFMNDPDLLILDEPTSGLDPVLQDTFRELVRERLDRGATVWLTSHVMSDLEDVADRVGLIDRGRLVKDLSMDDLRRQASDRLTFTFASAPAPDAFDGVAGVVSASASDAEMSLHVEGPVAAVLARAAELGAVPYEVVATGARWTPGDGPMRDPPTASWLIARGHPGGRYDGVRR